MVTMVPMVHQSRKQRTRLLLCILFLIAASRWWDKVDGFTVVRPLIRSSSCKSTTATLHGGSFSLFRVRRRNPADTEHFQLRMAERGAGDDDKEKDETTKDNDGKNRNTDPLFRRFTAPIIDDPGLPLSDVLVAQVIAPSLQIAWLSAAHAPQPSWLRPLFDADLLYTRQGAFVAPALLHGAALAVCWVVGALAAKAYERRSISPVRAATAPPPTTTATSSSSSNNDDESTTTTSTETSWDYSNVLKAILQAGAFATGLLILATQTDLFMEYGRWVQVGESDEIDFRLLVALVELVNDVVFEAVTIAVWRLFLAYQTERMAS